MSLLQLLTKITGELTDKNTEINVDEAHILWRILADRHVMIDHLNQLKNFTHDQDFLIYLNNIVTEFQNDAKMLSHQLENYSITGPQPSARTQNTGGNSEVVRDQETAEVLFGFMRLDLGLKLASLKGVNTNDDVRRVIIGLLKNSLERIDNLIKYLKLKGWISFPPLYPYTQPNVPEQVAVNEIYLIWDHLVARYNNIRQTEIFISLAADPDFKLILETGLDVLKKQAKQLEDKLLYFGVTLPPAYTSVTIPMMSKQHVEDKLMFNLVLRGIQDAIALHGLALQEIVVNDEIRKYFKHLTLEELDYADKMSKYGRLKGWNFVVPTYKGNEGSSA